MDLDIDSCAEGLAAFLREHPEVKGPHETAYGMGFPPTISYWRNRRRVHLYEDCDKFAAEIADPDTCHPQRLHVENIATIERIIEAFLCNSCEIIDLPGSKWISDSLDHDKFIPDPPNRSNPANLGPITGGHVVEREPGDSYHPTIQRKTAWWQFWK